MKLRIIAKTKSRRPGVTQLTDSVYEVRVAEPPVAGKANQAVIHALAKHLGVKKSQIIITSGHTTPHKGVEIVA